MSYGAACPRCASLSYIHTCMPGKTLTCFIAGWTCVKPALMEDDPRYACLCFVGGSDDMLSKVLTTLIELKALLPALMMMSNPFQSASSLTSKQAEAQASDFKAKTAALLLLDTTSTWAAAASTTSSTETAVYGLPAPLGEQADRSCTYSAQGFSTGKNVASIDIKAKQCTFTHLSMCSGAPALWV